MLINSCYQASTLGARDRAALLRYKLADSQVCEWRDNKVFWIQLIKIVINQ